jgi:hypothetical protein
LSFVGTVVPLWLDMHGIALCDSIICLGLLKIKHFSNLIINIAKLQYRSEINGTYPYSWAKQYHILVAKIPQRLAVYIRY